MQVVHLDCGNEVGSNSPMKQMERTLEARGGKRRLLVVFRCEACAQMVEISRPARPGEKLGVTPKD